MSSPDVMPLKIAEAVDILCDHFEEAWNSCPPAEIEPYLAKVPAPYRAILLRELILLDWQCRLAAGQIPTRHDYQLRFPDDAELIEQLELAAEANSSQAAISRPELSWEQFYQRLVDSRILSELDLHRIADQFCHSAEPRRLRPLMHWLIDCRILTSYQINQLKLNKGTELVLGDYVVTDHVGDGGMGQVLKAQHRRMGRTVAIKVLHAKRRGSREAIERFQREVKALARLNHPNVVTAYDAGEAGYIQYLVMEYVDGADLRNRVKLQGALPVQQAIDTLIQAASGLAYAHDQGIIHRDIKPANLLLDRSGTVKILDLGLARIDGNIGPLDATRELDLTNSGQIMGTGMYMAPEQALDPRNFDCRADIYSLGCMLYYSLTGEAPFREDTMMKTLIAHREKPAPSLHAKRDDVPRSLEHAYRRMMAKKPEDRFQTMREVITAMEECRAREPAHARQDSLSDRLPFEVVPPPVVAASRDYSHPRPQLTSASNRDQGWGAADTATAKPPRGEKQRAAVSMLGDRTRIIEDTVVDEAAEHDTATFTTTVLKAVRRSPLLVGGMIALGLLVLALATAVIMTIRTSAGEIVVKSDDPGIKVTVSRKGELVAIIDQATGWEVSVAKGHYDLSIGDSSDTFKLDKQTVEVTRNAKQIVQVSLIAPASLERPKADVVAPAPPVARVSSTRDNAEPLKDTTSAPRDPVVPLTPVEAISVRPRLNIKEHSDFVMSLVFSPDGKSLFSSGGEGGIKVIDVESGAVRKTLSGHVRQAHSIVVFPDGNRLVSAGGRDKKVLVWNLADGSSREIGPQQSFVWNLATSPDWKTLAATGGGIGGSDEIPLWNIETGELLKTLRGHQEMVLRVAFSPDGKKLASFSKDRTVKLWDYQTGRELVTFDIYQFTDMNEHPVFSPDGTLLAAPTGGDTVTLWDTATGKTRAALATRTGGSFNVVAFTPKGDRFVVAGHVLATVWDAATGKNIRTLGDGHKPVMAASLSPDGHTLAWAENDQTIGLWDIRNGRKWAVLHGNNDHATLMGFSPDGKHFAAAGLSEHRIKVWRIPQSTESNTN